MTAFRNALGCCGAAFGAAYFVGALRWWVLYPLTGLGVANGSAQFAWAVGVGAAVAVLAGVGAGIAVQTSRPGGWSVLLAVLVAWSGGRSLSATAYPDAFSHALAEFSTSVIAAAIAFGSFHVARGWFLRRLSVANAR